MSDQTKAEGKIDTGAIRAEHPKVNSMSREKPPTWQCDACWPDLFPCEATQLCDEVDRLRGELARVEAERARLEATHGEAVVEDYGEPDDASPDYWAVVRGGE